MLLIASHYKKISVHYRIYIHSSIDSLLTTNEWMQASSLYIYILKYSSLPYLQPLPPLPTNLLSLIEFPIQKRTKKLNIFWSISIILSPILPLLCFKPRGKRVSLLVLASNPCFLERGVLGRCKTDWVGSLGCHWSGTAYTTRTPLRRTPWVSTLHVAALLSPLTHKPAPA